MQRSGLLASWLWRTGTTYGTSSPLGAPGLLLKRQACPATAATAVFQGCGEKRLRYWRV
jgi:hypothetical protein